VTAARVCFASTILFLVLVGALHVLRPDLDPSWHVLSEYSIADRGWLNRLEVLTVCWWFLTVALHAIRRHTGLSRAVQG
jgi:hypothetical protein